MKKIIEAMDLLTEMAKEREQLIEQMKKDHKDTTTLEVKNLQLYTSVHVIRTFINEQL